MKKIIAAAVLAGTFFAGCKAVDSKLAGSYEVTALEVAGEEQAVVAADVTFTRKGLNTYELNGNSGVNNFFGSVKIDGTAYKAGGNFGSTRMAGAPEAEAFENNFLAALQKSDACQVTEENGAVTLTLTGKDSDKKVVLTKK